MRNFIINEKNYGEILFFIFISDLKNVLNRVQASRFFGIIIDESTDIFVISQLIVIVSSVKEHLPLCSIFKALNIEDVKKDICIIFNTFKRSMKKCGLNFDKFVEFGSDGDQP